MTKQFVRTENVQYHIKNMTSISFRRSNCCKIGPVNLRDVVKIELITSVRVCGLKFPFESQNKMFIFVRDSSAREYKTDERAELVWK